MLPLTMIASLALLGFVGSVSGYAISRTQDYPSYSSGSHAGQTFSTLKEAQDSLASTNYAPVSNSRQYSTLYGSHSSSPSFGDASSQSSSYGAGASDALNSLSASYQNDAADLSSSYSAQGLDYASANQHSASPSYSTYSGSQSDQLAGLEYPSTGQAGATYTSSSSGSNSYGAANPVSASYAAASPVSASYAAASPVSGSYTASSPVSTSYTSGGPVSAYSGPKAHTSGSPYPATSSFLPASHQGSGLSAGHAPSFSGHSASFSGSHYPSESQPSYSESPRLPASLKNFMASMHRESPGSYYTRPSSSHGSNYIHSPSSFSKAPGSYYSAGGNFPKSGSKIILVKDGAGGHALMHPESGYSGGVSFPAGSNYKVRNAGPLSSGHHFQGSASTYSHPSVYSGGPSSHPGGPSSPYFQY